MSSLKKLTLATAALFASTAIVNAADIFVPDPEPVPEAKIHHHHSGGWYLRGDLGYAHMSVHGATKVTARVDPFDPLSVIYQHDAFYGADLDESWNLSVGVGYQINDYLRVDATLGHIFDTNFIGDSSTSGPGYACSLLDGAPDADGDTCTTVDSAEFSATTLLANAYIDLGTFSGFTPYVGAGIGGAHTHWTSTNNDARCDGVGDCLSDAGLSYDTEFDSVHAPKNGWRFAYALHAGASYDLTESLKFDAGYSFTHIDGGDMFGFVGAGASAQANHGSIKVHEVRAGLRYSLH